MLCWVFVTGVVTAKAKINGQNEVNFELRALNIPHTMQQAVYAHIKGAISYIYDTNNRV